MRSTAHLDQLPTTRKNQGSMSHDQDQEDLPVFSRPGQPRSDKANGDAKAEAGAIHA